MSVSRRMKGVLRWLARQLPARQEVREAEWLAELEQIGTPFARLDFVLGCALATLRLQQHPLRFVWRMLLQIVRPAFRLVGEDDVLSFERGNNLVFFEAQQNQLVGSPGVKFFAREERLAPEENEFRPVRFDAPDEQKKREQKP